MYKPLYIVLVRKIEILSSKGKRSEAEIMHTPFPLSRNTALLALPLYEFCFFASYHISRVEDERFIGRTFIQSDINKIS